MGFEVGDDVLIRILGFRDEVPGIREGFWQCKTSVGLSVDGSWWRGLCVKYWRG